MKKIVAIALLALLLFNLGGYQLLFQYLIYHSDVVITDQINNNHYRSSDLVEVKIPVHLNITDWPEYEPISGQVKSEGICYNYAELKMTRDTMYLKCIPNQDKAHLIYAKTVYAKQVNDVPLNKKAHDPLLKKVNTLSDYKLQAFQYCYTGFGISLRQINRSVSYRLTWPYIASPGKPPNFIG